jgi:hypothetical protein
MWEECEMKVKMGEGRGKDGGGDEGMWKGVRGVKRGRGNVKG